MIQSRLEGGQSCPQPAFNRLLNVVNERSLMSAVRNVGQIGNLPTRSEVKCS